jgi:hypothetical protein
VSSVDVDHHADEVYFGEYNIERSPSLTTLFIILLVPLNFQASWIYIYIYVCVFVYFIYYTIPFEFGLSLFIIVVKGCGVVN